MFFQQESLCLRLNSKWPTMAQIIETLDKAIELVKNDVIEDSGVYAFKSIDVDGKETSLSKYKNKLLLICNVASI